MFRLLDVVWLAARAGVEAGIEMGRADEAGRAPAAAGACRDDRARPPVKRKGRVRRRA
ncbi:hypothetical protein [Burkholderia cepacia]|uniref:hypothetical protein n=1 Tax=Burkholderia cepacia TaxID=292 RepID=UPI0012DAC30C|nr:hypothetical protein [Burkholderia cepacia]HDR9497832.1 hypothetical protein [Burkholderia cepacia]